MTLGRKFCRCYGHAARCRVAKGQLQIHFGLHQQCPSDTALLRVVRSMTAASSGYFQYFFLRPASSLGFTTFFSNCRFTQPQLLRFVLFDFVHQETWRGRNNDMESGIQTPCFWNYIAAARGTKQRQPVAQWPGRLPAKHISTDA